MARSIAEDAPPQAPQPLNKPASHQTIASSSDDDKPLMQEREQKKGKTKPANPNEAIVQTPAPMDDSDLADELFADDEGEDDEGAGGDAGGWHWDPLWGRNPPPRPDGIYEQAEEEPAERDEEVEPSPEAPADAYMDQLLPGMNTNMSVGEMQDNLDKFLLIAQSWLVQLDGSKYTKELQRAVDSFIAEMVLFRSMLEPLDEMSTSGQCSQVGYHCIANSFQDLRHDVRPHIETDLDPVNIVDDSPPKRRRMSFKQPP